MPMAWKSVSLSQSTDGCAINRGRNVNHIEIGYFGLHWPDLDEDLSHAGLRSGRFGQS
jgi:hypothetical protein